MSSRRPLWPRAARWVAALAIAGLLIAVATAMAAVHFRSGGLYTGKTAACGSTVSGATCVVKFRASKTGRSLRFVGKTVIDTWGCRGGGGEALLGGKVKNATPIPVVHLHSDGTLHGSVAYTFKPTSVPLEHLISSVTGHITNSGKGAVITFHMSSGSARSQCSTLPVTLTKRGTAVGGPH